MAIGAQQSDNCAQLKPTQLVSKERERMAGATIFVFLCTVGSAHRSVGMVLRPITAAIGVLGAMAGQTIGYLASTERVVQYRLFACAANLCSMELCTGDCALLPAALVAGGALDVGAVHTHTRMHMHRRAHTRMLTHTHMQCHAHMMCVRGVPMHFCRSHRGSRPLKRFDAKYVPCVYAHTHSLRTQRGSGAGY